MYSQIWLNVLVNDHQFGYITELKKKRKTLNSMWLVTCFLGAFFLFFPLKKKKILFLLSPRFVPLSNPASPTASTPFPFHLLPLVEEGGKLSKLQLKPGIRWVVDFVLPTALGLYYSSDISTTLARLYVLQPLQVQMGGVLDSDLIWSIILLLLLIWLSLCRGFERLYDQGFYFSNFAISKIWRNFQQKKTVNYDRIHAKKKKKKKKKNERSRVGGWSLWGIFSSRKFKMDPKRN